MTRSWSRRFVQVHQRVLEFDPIAYWLLDEKSGAVAYDRAVENGAQNGAHVGVTLYQPGMGDGRACPYYDGANDYTDVFTAAFAGAFDGSEGSVTIWVKVANAGVWTDGATRRALFFRADVNNYVFISKDAVNNLMQLGYRAGGANAIKFLPGVSDTTFFHLALTWSATANQVCAYYKGAIIGAPMAIPGVWAGVLAATFVNIGAQRTTPNFVWDGYLAHGAAWDRPLTAAEIAGLAVA